MLALAGIAAIFCRSLSACRRPLHCRLVESEKPTASPQRSPETQIDHRPDGLRRRPPVIIPFFAFRGMVGMGLIMMAVSWLGLLLVWRGRLESAHWFLWAAFLSFPTGFV